MRRFVPRISVVAWAAAAALVVVFARADVRAQDDHEPATHATAEDAHADEAHAAGEEEHGSDDHHSTAEGGHGDIDYNEPPLPITSSGDFSPGKMFNALFFWSLGLFLLFLVVAKKLAWTPLIEGLDAREARVNRALHDAEAARVEAEKLLAEHEARMEQVQEEVKDIVAAARQAAEVEKAKIIAEADAEAAAMRDQAVSDIQAAHRQAIDDLDARIDGQVTVATEHVLGHRG